METENGLATIETGQLTKILTDSKLELSEAETIKQSYLPYFQQLAEIKEQAAKIDFVNPKALDETISRELRLKTVKIRTGSEAIKEERKRIHMLKANVEQSAWNLIKSTCQLDEERFLQVEKKRELEEKRRKELLKTERIALLTPFEVQAEFYDLANMPENAFEQLLENSKLAFQRKKKEAEKEERDRIERERIAEEKRQEMIAENARLQKEAKEREEKATAERAEAAKKLAAAEAKAEAERKAAEKKLAEERQKAEVEAKIAKEKADAEAKAVYESQQRVLAKERAEREKAEKELADKAEAERKAKEDATAKLEAELSKGDSEKFADLLSDLETLKAKYSFKSAKYKKLQVSLVEMLQKMILYLNSK